MAQYPAMSGKRMAISKKIS